MEVMCVTCYVVNYIYIQQRVACLVEVLLTHNKEQEHNDNMPLNAGWV
jgi:hypothetical protein